MKKIIKYTAIFVLFTSLLASCTKDYEELNTDKSKIVILDNASLDYVFSAAQFRGIAFSYQLFNNLFCDAQAQFFGCTQPKFQADRNVMVGSWLDGGWNSFYAGSNPQMDVVLDYTKKGGKLESPIKNAIAKIWKVYIFMPITDSWGAIPYSQAGNGQHSVLYDSQEEIYTNFFTLLKESTAVLNTYTGTDKFFEKGDLIYGGNVKKWLKLGNTLRLRAALRISKVNPTEAKIQAEAAANPANGGLITSNTDNAILSATAVTYENPLSRISDWTEFRMSASMESVLKGYADPRMQKFFDPALTGGVYKGVRNGMSIVQMTLPANGFNSNSNINTSFGFANRAKAPYNILTAAETNFLLAEGALNGWNMGGTAVSFYNKGIEQSFLQWGLTSAQATTYQAGITTPIALGDAYNTPAMTNIPVLFSGTEAQQREQIGTQKWLALYPFNGAEAWAEIRRTGFPKLYPRLNSENLDSPAADPASVRRLTYPPIEASVNAAGLASGVAKLGGADKTSTKVWWNL